VKKQLNTNVSWKILLAAPATLGVALVASGKAAAADPIFVESSVDESADVSADVVISAPIQLAQVTSVSELSDVQPGDWAFTALQRLVEEYGWWALKTMCMVRFERPLSSRLEAIDCSVLFPFERHLYA
jgi:hypothetical protein